MQCGACVDVADSQGQTLLHTAVANNEAQMAELLVHFGADISTPDHAGCSSVQRAMEEGKELLLQRMLTGHAQTLHTKPRLTVGFAPSVRGLLIPLSPPRSGVHRTSPFLAASTHACVFSRPPADPMLLPG